MKLKSTLPSLFQIIKNKTQQQQQQQQQSSASKPITMRHRQGPFYSINLTQTHQNQSSSSARYRSKIMNSSFQKINKIRDHSQNDEDFQSNRFAKFRNSNNTIKNQSRTLSVYSYKRSQAANLNMTIGYGWSNSQHKVSQFDNIHANLKKVQQHLYILQRDMQPVANLHSELNQEINEVKYRFQEQIKNMEKHYTNKVSHLKNMLSQLRRQTNQEIKSQKNQIQIFNEEVTQMNEVAYSIEQQRAKFEKKYF